MRNNVLDFYRIVFTLIICLHHFQGVFNMSFLANGYIGVEFFFILSGFFLYKSFKKHRDESAIGYTTKKLKRLYPEYIVAFMLFFLLRVMQNRGDIISYIIKAISEITLIQNIGVFKGGINYPLWYLSVLIFAGYIIFEILKKNEDTFIKIISPIFIVFTFSLLNYLGKGLENWNIMYGLYLPLLRGTAEMCIGILSAKFIESKYFTQITDHKNICYIIEILTYVFLSYIIICQNEFEIYSIVFIPILICIANNPSSISSKVFNRNIFGKVGKITYSMYVNHAIFIEVMALIYKKVFNKNINMIVLIAIYLSSLIIYSIISRKLIMNIVNKYREKQYA